MVNPEARESIKSNGFLWIDILFKGHNNIEI
jgi:hypothetical protein